MKRFKARLLSATLVAVMGIMGIAGCGATLDGTKIVATIDGENVPLGVASFALRYSQAQSDSYYKQLAALYGELGIAGQNWDEVVEGETKTMGEQTKDGVIEHIEKMYQVKAHAKEYGVELEQAEKDNIAAAAKEFIANNEKSLLSRIGVTESDVAEYLELETYLQKAYEPMTKDTEITITEEEAAQSSVTYTFLSTNNLEGEAKEQAREQLEGLLAEFKKEEDIATFDMEAFATEKDAGFMTSTITFGNDDEDGGFDVAAREAARTLQDGEMYQEVIEGASGGGYFIVRLDKANDEEATAQKRETLEAEQKRAAFDEMVADWIAKADIKVDEKVWEKVKLNNKEVYTIKANPEEEVPTVEEPAGEEPAVEVPEGGGVEVEMEPAGGDVEVEMEPAGEELEVE